MRKQVIVAAAWLVVALAIVDVGTAVAQSQRFPDVPPDHYAFGAVEWAAGVGVTAGYSDGTFKPQRPLSKRHAVVFVERYYDEILQADESEDFSRGDMMVLLKSINDGTLRGHSDETGATGVAQSQRFPDVPPDHYAFGAVEWAAGVGVTAGYSDGTFKPQRPLSKRHAVVFVERYYDEILQADESEDFSRGDMMVLLKSINDGQIGQSDAIGCRIRNVGRALGFPAQHSTASSTGTLRVAVLFADFPNAEAEYSTVEEAERGLPYAERYLEASSYDKLDVEFTPLHSWIRLPNDHTQYVSTNAAGYETVSGQVYETVTRLADPKFDFTSQDAVMVVFPSALFSGGEARIRGGPLLTNEGTVQASSLINVYMPWWVAEKQEPFYRPDDPQFWGEMAVHELLHMLGLPDYYAYRARWFPHEPEGFQYDTSRFGPLNLTIQSLHPGNDPGRGSSFREMLAWSRYQLEWLDDRQVRCVTEEGRFYLRSLASLAPGTIGMLGIPLSDTSVAVVQSVRWAGFDSPCDSSQMQQPLHLRSCGHGVSGPEGVLVYIVDSSIPGGDRPIRIAGEDSDGVVHWSPLLGKAQGVVVGQYEIEVVASSDTRHEIVVTRPR